MSLSVRLFASRRPGRLFPASADVVFYLSFRLSVHLSVRCVSVCAPVRLSSGGPPVSFVCVRRPRLLLVRSSSPLSLAYVVCYLSFRWSVHLSVRPCFCLCACSPVVGRTACFLRLRPSASPPSSPSMKPSVCRAPGARTRGAALSRRGVPRPGRAHLPRRSPLRAFRSAMRLGKSRQRPSTSYFVLASLAAPRSRAPNAISHRHGFIQPWRSN